MTTTWVGLGDDPDAMVWTFIVIYFCMLLAVAAYSYWSRYGISNETLREQMEFHYLANKSLGTVVLMLTIFSTVFSGYTVAGVPNEVFGAGFFAFRWLFCVLPIVVMIIFFGDKLRGLSSKRSYISPTGFIADRFNSHLLTVFISLGLAFPAMIYVLAQFKSMGDTIQSLSNGDIDAFDAAAVFCVIMLCYEVFGGLRAIAWTDALQGGIMCVGFIMFYGVQEELFGGAEEAGNYISKIGPLGHILPKDWRTAWISFGTNIFFSFCFYPHMIQRYQAASSSYSFKLCCIFLFIGTWLAMTSSLVTGMVALNYFKFGNPHVVQNGAFAALMRVAMNEGFGYNLLGSTLITASLAAFMSTADSALNGVSCCVTLDILKPYPGIWKFWCGDWLAGGCNDTLWRWFGIDLTKKTWTTNEIVGMGKVVSITCAVIALKYSREDFELGALLTMQGGMLCQVFPAFFLGMVTDFVKPIPVLIGFFTGSIMTIVVQCDNGQDDCVRKATDPSWFWPIEGMDPAMFALILNCAIAILFSLKNRTQPMWDKINAGNQFPQELLGFNTSTGNEIRPYHWPYNIVMVLIMAIAIFAVPWYRGEDDGTPEEFTDGLPQYVRDGFVVASVCTALGFIATVCFWSGEDNEVLDHPWPICLWAPDKSTATEGSTTGQKPGDGNDGEKTNDSETQMTAV